MGLLCNITGPKSKYRESIPSYTYEAKAIVIDDEYKSFFADNLCALLEYLVVNKVEPDQVELYEIFKNEEKKLHKEYCVSEEGRWLTRGELCVAFTERYPDHIQVSGCTVEDRDRKL